MQASQFKRVRGLLAVVKTPGGTSVSIQDRIEATAKNLEGKIQEAVGELTGDEKQKLEGKAKQMEAAAQHAKEDLKDAVKEGVDNLLG
ncbi:MULTISPECIES: CsbD family protein [unclassified Synechococcus]|uniref:CsbD family protein n=1 Tax=unclassified Synechococcus TaxID=2626047 RepID=UPI0039C12B33